MGDLDPLPIRPCKFIVRIGFFICGLILNEEKLKL